MKIQIGKYFKSKENKKSKSQNNDDKDYMASQWKLMGRKLKKHKLARVSIFILFILYFQALFGQFIAPHGTEIYESKYMNCPPTDLHWIDEEGEFQKPFVYGIKMERDKETFRKIYVEDKSVEYSFEFFVKGEPYKFLGLFETDRHLFGVNEPGKYFIFGTDGMGRDLFSRILIGSQISLTIPLVGVAISFVIGVFMGGISGYFGGTIDNIIQRIIEIIRSFPSLPLWMALAAAIPPRVPMIQMYFYIVIILSFMQWTGLARTVRSQFIAIRKQDFVMAAKIAGVGDMKIILVHLVPGFMSYLIVNMTLGIPTMILGETSMSFLGLGILPPATSWGVLLQEAQKIQNVALCPWKLIPLIYVIVTVIAFNFLGDGLRDAADPYK